MSEMYSPAVEWKHIKNEKKKLNHPGFQVLKQKVKKKHSNSSSFA